MNLKGLFIGQRVWVTAGMGLFVSGVVHLGNLPAAAQTPTSQAYAAQTAITQLLFVNPLLGSDQTGDGSQRSPFRSITRAAQAAQPNTVIVLATGTYSQRTGEQFPVRLPPGVRVQSDPVSQGNGVVIQGEILQGETVASTAATVETRQPRATASRSSRSTTPAFPSPTSVNSAAAIPSESAFSNSFVQPVEIPETVVPVTAASIPVSPPASRSRRSPTAQSGGGVPIPVPPPVSNSASNPARSTASRATAQANSQRSQAVNVATTADQTIMSFEGPVEIPVPPPASSRPAARPRPTTSTAPRNRPAPTTVARRDPPARRPAASQYDLLPVPAIPPVGNVGDMPRVSASASQSWRSSAPVASRAAQAGLRYRVLVEANNETVNDRVQQLFPSSFLTFLDGDVMMQVGAFSDRNNAEEAAERLARDGIRAKIESVE